MLQSLIIWRSCSVSEIDRDSQDIDIDEDVEEDFQDENGLLNLNQNQDMETKSMSY